MGWGSTSEPDFPQPASSEGQELGCLQSIISEPAKKVDANLPGSESLTTPQGFSSKPPVPDSRSFPKVATCNIGSLGATNNHPPTPDTRNFHKILAHDTGSSGSKISKSANDDCPKISQSPENSASPEYLPNTNYHVIEKKS
ncbi:hypothetical protein DSO57_1004874 [Entomophthora muscae]|uniref:Uncharacterized protein n=1 Tax=Entomophthora muscae TaxID=34485 RepID=A0ACC2RZ32_9FUNG|nr:hypothetical protein DSO57_1004874 [Entomophthora muscae]